MSKGGRVLATAAVIELGEADLDDVANFLSVHPMASRRWHPVLEYLRKNPDAPLATVLVRPLTASLARLVQAE